MPSNADVWEILRPPLLDEGRNKVALSYREILTTSEHGARRH